MFELLLLSLKIQEHCLETPISDRPWSGGLDMATPVTGFVSLQGSISDSTNILCEVTFPARVLKSYSVRKAFFPSTWFHGVVGGGGVRDKYGVGVSTITGTALVGSAPLFHKSHVNCVLSPFQNLLVHLFYY